MIQIRVISSTSPEYNCAATAAPGPGLLDGHDVRMLVAHHPTRSQPVHIADRLIVGLLSASFSSRGATAHMRIGFLNQLAIQLEHQAQHTVRGRMLRPEFMV